MQAQEKNSPAYAIKACSLTCESTTWPGTFCTNAMHGGIHREDRHHLQNLL